MPKLLLSCLVRINGMLHCLPNPLAAAWIDEVSVLHLWVSICPGPGFAVMNVVLAGEAKSLEFGTHEVQFSASSLCRYPFSAGQFPQQKMEIVPPPSIPGESGWVQSI